MFLNRLLLLSLAMLYSSCIEMKVAIQVHADGSAEIEKKFGIASDMAQMTHKQGESGDYNKDSIAFAKQGFSVKSYKADGFEGVIGQKSVTNLTELSPLLNFNTDSLKSSQGATAPFTEKKGFFKNHYKFHAVLDLAGKDANSKSAQMMQNLLSSARMEIQLKLPVTPLSHNANQVSPDGKTLTWAFKMGQVNQFDMEAETWNWWNLLFVSLALILSIVSMFRKQIFKKLKSN